MLRLIASGSRLLLMRLTPRINRDTNIRCYLNRVVPFPGSPPSNRLCVFLIDSTIRISGRCDVGSDETFYNYQLCNSDKLTLVSITYKHTTHGHGSNFTLPNWNALDVDRISNSSVRHASIQSYCTTLVGKASSLAIHYPIESCCFATNPS